MNQYDIIAVMIFIFDSQQNVLLLERCDNGFWEPVKGGMDAGESWSQAAAREMREETGLSPVSEFTLFKVVDDKLKKSDDTTLNIKGHVTFCFVSGERPTPDFSLDTEIEHRNYRWVSINDLGQETVWPPIASDMLSRIINDLKFKKAQHY